MTDNDRSPGDSDQRLADGGTTTPTFVTPDDLDSAAPTPGVERGLAFETETNVMVQSSVAGNTATGWHHHGDRDVFIYLLEGDVALEYGPNGDQVLEGSAPMFAHVPPGLVHRDRNPADTEQVSIINFVGEGPVVVNVDGPNAAD